MFNIKINYAENLLRNFTIKNLKVLNPKWVPHFMGISNHRFIIGNLRGLNRLCTSPQVTDKKLYKIRQNDQAASF